MDGRQTSALDATWSALQAGTTATAAMSAVMEAWKRVVPEERPRDIPPRQVTREITRRTGIWQRLGAGGRHTLTYTSHFGFGVAMAAVFAETVRRVPVPPVVGGAAFGLGVWAASYAGVLPALGLLPSPNEKPPERVAMLVSAHLVWGATLGAMYHVLARRERRPGQKVGSRAQGTALHTR